MTGAPGPWAVPSRHTAPGAAHTARPGAVNPPVYFDDSPTVPLRLATQAGRPGPQYAPLPFAAPAVHGPPQGPPGRRTMRRAPNTMSRSQHRRLALELERAVAAIPLPAPITIAVVGGKGGIGKTTVAASLGTLLAELRPHDGVVAVDADTAFGKLGARVDPGAAESFRRLRDATGSSYVEVRNALGHNASGLSVCVGGEQERGGTLGPELYRGVINSLKRHFALSIVDCSTNMDAPITAEVLRDADAVIVVSSPWGDGAEVAARTVEWMWVRGLHALVHRSVVVVNDTDGHAVDAGVRTPPPLPHARTVVVPFDRGLRSGAPITGSDLLSKPTRLSFLEIAKAVLDRVGGHPRRR